MTMKAHTYYVIFGRPPIGGKLPPVPPCGTTGEDWIGFGVRLCLDSLEWSMKYISYEKAEFSEIC